MYGRGGAQISFGPPQTPEIIKNLLIANGVVFIAQLIGPQLGFDVTSFGVVQPDAVLVRYQLWRIFTYMWLHSPDSIMHIAANMLSLWMFGSPMAQLWGPERFLRYYLFCGIGAGFMIATLPFLLGLLGIPSPDVFSVTLGASGAVMGVLLAFSFTWPDRTIMLLFPPIPIRAIYLIPVLFVMEWMSSATSGSNVSHTGHLAGVLVGWIYLLNEGRTPGAPTLNSFLLKWRRYRMRQKIRAVQREDRDERRRDDDVRRFH